MLPSGKQTRELLTFYADCPHVSLSSGDRNNDHPWVWTPSVCFSPFFLLCFFHQSVGGGSWASSLSVAAYLEFPRGVSLHFAKPPLTQECPAPSSLSHGFFAQNYHFLSVFPSLTQHIDLAKISPTIWTPSWLTPTVMPHSPTFHSVPGLTIRPPEHFRGLCT